MTFSRLWVVLLMIYSSPLRADCPSLPSTLGKPALYSLKEAQKITAEKNIFRKQADDHEYKVKILYSHDVDKFLVILGETHVKTPLAGKIGSEVIRYFRLRGFEYVPQNEPSKLSFNELIKVLVAYETAPPALSAGSTIDEMLKDGLTLAPKDWTFLPTGSKPQIDYDAWMYNDLDPLIEASYFVNIALETGCSIDSVELSDSRYVIDDRNERMVDNVISILSKTEKSPSLLIVVGKAHVSGIAERLINQFEFETCSF